MDHSVAACRADQTTDAQGRPGRQAQAGVTRGSGAARESQTTRTTGTIIGRRRVRSPTQPAQRLAGVAAQHLDVVGAVRHGLGQRVGHHLARLAQQLLGLGRVHPAPGGDLRGAAQRAALAGRRWPPPSPRPPRPASGGRAAPRGRCRPRCRPRRRSRPGPCRRGADPLGVEPHRVAVLAQQHLVGRHAHRAGQRGVVDHVAVLAVHRDEALGSGHRRAASAARPGGRGRSRAPPRRRSGPPRRPGGAARRSPAPPTTRCPGSGGR